jgi:hypothetical protein
MDGPVPAPGVRSGRTTRHRPPAPPRNATECLLQQEIAVRYVQKRQQDEQHEIIRDSTIKRSRFS